MHNLMWPYHLPGNKLQTEPDCGSKRLYVPLNVCAKKEKCVLWNENYIINYFNAGKLYSKLA